MNRARRYIFLFLIGFSILCLAVASVSYLSNRGLPSEPARLDVLSDTDKTRLAEALHLKGQLGERVWPGWGEKAIPVLLWNHEYSFLVGLPDAPAGWENVGGDTFFGEPYNRQPSADPQNFAVDVDGVWVASMATKWETDAFMIEMFEDILPPLIEAVFPYRLLILPSEVQITGVLHETFHVFQMQAAPERLMEAENSHKQGSSYWGVDEAMHAAWETEIDLLRKALGASSDQQVVEAVLQFLEARESRLAAHSLSSELIAFERNFEWEEGLAKYVELEIWRQAFESGTYSPSQGMDLDPDFKQYRSFEQRWSQELGQMSRQASREGDTRFYYTGMAQAMLLDRLLPDWKERVFEHGIWLDSLLAEAIRNQE